MFHLQLAATFVISWFTCFSFSFSFSFIFPALQHTSILFPVQTIIQLTTANLKLFTIATVKLGRLLNRWSTAVPPRPLTQKKNSTGVWSQPINIFQLFKKEHDMENYKLFSHCIKIEPKLQLISENGRRKSPSARAPRWFLLLIS